MNNNLVTVSGQQSEMDDCVVRVLDDYVSFGDKLRMTVLAKRNRGKDKRRFSRKHAA